MFAIWLLLKLLKFNLGFYYSDLYSHIQLSNFWLRVEDLLNENRYGDNKGLHNYYLNPVLGIFTYWSGAYGLFFAHLGLIFLGTWQWLRYHNKTKLDTLLLFALFLGPMAYWFWDNRPYGWHAELLYFPLVFLCAQNLKRANLKIAIVWAICISLVREDGILLIWALGIGFLLIDKKSKPLSKEIVFFSLGCLVLFIAGIVLIEHFSVGASRLNKALNLEAIGDAEIFKNLAFNFGGYLLFALPLFLLLLIYYPIKYTFITIIISLPIFFGAWVSGLYYLPDTYHSVLWQPRMIALWSVALGQLVLLGDSKNATFRLPISLGIVLLWGLQFITLVVLRQHNLFTMTTDILKEGKIYSQDKRYAVVKQIAKSTPHEAFVVVPYEYFHLFHKHKIIWPDHVENALHQPDLIVAREEDSAWSKAYESMHITAEKEGIIIRRKVK